MPILDLQRRMHETGRIRIGHTATTSSGKKAPAKLDRFRLTSADRDKLERAAALYGGTVAEWTAPAGKQWELYTEADAIPVVVPPTDMAFSQWFEMWSGGGCDRRCDGATELLTDGPCVCGPDPEQRECKPTTRLSVLLPELDGIGLWRLESHGYYAASELAGVVDVIQLAAGRGLMLPATLRLDQRIVKKKGQQTRKFAVPTLDVSVPTAQMLPGGATSAVGELQVGAQERPSLSPVQPSDEPAPSVADQIGQVAARVAEGPQRTARSAAAVPTAGVAPRTVDQARATEIAPPAVTTTHPVAPDLDAQRRKFHAILGDEGLDYKTQVQPWLLEQYGQSLSGLVGTEPMAKMLAALDRPEKRQAFVVSVREHADEYAQDNAGNDGEDAEPSLVERAFARADGDQERAALRTRINDALRVLSFHDHDSYAGLWERLTNIVGGNPSEVDWAGSPVKRLAALADDAERLAREVNAA